MIAGTDNLRFFLRSATAEAHEQLDASMRAASGWECERDYARFLALQHAARRSVEAWLDAHAPDDLHPPAQTPLIASDLSASGEELPQGPLFSHPETSRAAVLGIAWALAGSSLGNRAILKDVRRASGAAGSWPETFLADDTMPAFWAKLHREVERPADAVEAEAARRAAVALFDHFTRSVSFQLPNQMALAS